MKTSSTDISFSLLVMTLSGEQRSVWLRHMQQTCQTLVKKMLLDIKDKGAYKAYSQETSMNLRTWVLVSHLNQLHQY